MIIIRISKMINTDIFYLNNLDYHYKLKSLYLVSMYWLIICTLNLEKKSVTKFKVLNKT